MKKNYLLKIQLLLYLDKLAQKTENGDFWVVADDTALNWTNIHQFLLSSSTDEESSFFFSFFTLTVALCGDPFR